MRRLILALSAVFLSTGVALSVAFFVMSERAYSKRNWEEIAGRAQYLSEYYSDLAPSQDIVSTAPSEPTTEPESPEKSDRPTASARRPTQEGESPEALEAEGTISQGSVPGARAPAEAISVMEPPTPYSQIVDNASPRRFVARGWKENSRPALHYYGKDYHYVRPARDVTPARFRVKIPAKDYYTVYARWPSSKVNNAATRFGIGTTSGIKWVKVNQRRDGGMWVRLGAYEMEAGNRHAVRISGRSKAKGRVVADAIMVVRGTQMPPPQRDKREDARATGEAAGGGAVAGGAMAREIIQRARAHMGTPYRLSPPATCEAFRSEDCSCFTSLVFGKWLSLPDYPAGQWQAGQAVESSDLRPGDLVFFKEGGSSFITHVAIYSGRGNILHASSYWGSVVESPMKWVSGYYGAKRLY